MTQNFYYLREKALQIGAELTRSKTKLKQLMDELQLRCPHPVERIVRSEAKFHTMGTDPELRLCTQCGCYEHEGRGFETHGVPYNRQKEMRTINREELLHLRDTLFT